MKLRDNNKTPQHAAKRGPGKPAAIFFILLAVLTVAAFIIPPTAVIDRSVLSFIAEITGAAALLTFLVKLPEYIEKGGTARVTKGNTTIEVGGKSHHNRDEIINENDNPEEIEET